MDKLRKIGDWAWDNKERLVLAILVVFLAYRIYAVLNPTTLEEEAAARAAAAPTPANRFDDDDDDDMLGMGRFQRGFEQEAAPAAPAAQAPLVFTQHRPPRRIPDPTNLPDEWTEEEGRPPAPPPNPLPPAPIPFQPLVNDNPFTATTATTDGRPGDERRPDLRLLAIREWGTSGIYRANILTRTRGWYEEGEQFETYELVSIDPEAGTVEIFSEQHGRIFTYSLNR